VTALAQKPSNAGAERRITIVQGEQAVSAEPDVALCTLLGSCVAACIRDPVAGVGGMNHFLLPGDGARAPSQTSMSHGVHAMELLLNALLRQGARRDRLEAKLFGGANLMRGLTDVGAMNAAFAQKFLQQEGILHVGGSLGGDRGRRIQFWPVSGRARQVFLGVDERQALDVERVVRPAPVASGALELF
jgi:chemotaxis protein CheD